MNKTSQTKQRLNTNFFRNNPQLGEINLGIQVQSQDRLGKRGVSVGSQFLQENSFT